MNGPSDSYLNLEGASDPPVTVKRDVTLVEGRPRHRRGHRSMTAVSHAVHWKVCSRLSIIIGFTMPSPMAALPLKLTWRPKSELRGDVMDHSGDACPNPQAGV